MKNISLRKLFLYSVLIVVLVSLVSLTLNFFLSLDNSRKTERLDEEEITLLISLEDAKYEISRMLLYFKEASLTLKQRDFAKADLYYIKAGKDIKGALSVLPPKLPAYIKTADFGRAA